MSIGIDLLAQRRQLVAYVDCAQYAIAAFPPTTAAIDGQSVGYGVLAFSKRWNDGSGAWPVRL